MSLFHISMNAQSIIKYVSGKVYFSDTNELIEGINSIVNDSITLKMDPLAYMIIEVDGQKRMIKQLDYPEGIKIKDLKSYSNKEKTNSFWGKILDLVYDDSFENKQKIDGLYIANFQGVTRSIFEDSIQICKVLSNYKSKIEWPLGSSLKIESNDDFLIEMTEKDIDNTTINQNIFDDCKPCDVIIDDEKRGIIQTAKIDDQDVMFLKSLFDNLKNDKEVEISQFCIVGILIANELYLNANYYIEQFEGNQLLKQQLDYSLYGF